MMPINFDRCICFNVLFEKLKQVAETENIQTVEELQKKIKFGLHCGSCLGDVENLLNSKKGPLSGSDPDPQK